MEQHLAIKKLFLALFLCFGPNIAWAQCAGVFPANTFCGNNTTSPNVPTAVPFNAGTVVGPASSTSGYLPNWIGTSGLQLGSQSTIATSQNFTFGGTAILSTPIFTNALSGNNVITSNNLALGAALGNITSGTITTNYLSNSAVIPGTYSNANIVINNKGIITSATTGSSGSFNGGQSAFTQDGNVVCTPITSTNQMMGTSSAKMTPSSTGNVLVTINGTWISSNNTAGVGVAYQIFYGTGTIPICNGVSAGTGVGEQFINTIPTTASTSTVNIPFSDTVVITGLSKTTSYWFDLRAVSTPVLGFILNQSNNSAIEF